MEIGKSVKNIFDLVHHFGNEEDQISANFGFILKINETVLLDLLKKLSINIKKLKRKDIQRIDIETQVPYKYKGKLSIIDLRIKLDNEFLIFIESKIAGSSINKFQLKRYADLLRREKAFYHKIRLALITQFDRKNEFGNLKNFIGLKEDEFHYFRWENIRELVDKYNVKNELKFVNQLFLDYVGDKMGDKKIIAEQRIKDIKEVMIWSTNPDWWELSIKKKIICQDNNEAPDVQYIAFYRTAPISAITHIAKVKYTEKNVAAIDAIKKVPRLMEKAEKGKWTNEPLKIYHLEELIELPFPIRKGKGKKGVIRSYCFKTFAQLLNARKLEDLTR